MPHAPLDCDLLVVGSGAAGLAAAVSAAHLGKRVILVEKDAVLGGSPTAHREAETAKAHRG